MTTDAQKFRIGPGETVFIKNRATGQGAHLSIHEAFTYLGATVAFGTLGHSPIYIPAVVGRVEIPPRPSCPIIVPGCPHEDMVALSYKLGGSPLFMLRDSEAIKGEAILNGARVKGFGPEGMDRGAMVGRAIKWINLFRFWREHHGRLPDDYVEAKRTERDPDRNGHASDIWTPE